MSKKYVAPRTVKITKEDAEKLVGELHYKLFIINFYTSSYKVGDCANTR